MSLETELLHPREGSMLLRRAHGETLAEIGKVYGVGPERARQVIKAACQAVGATDPVHALAICLVTGIFDISDLNDTRIPDKVRETSVRVQAAQSSHGSQA